VWERVHAFQATLGWVWIVSGVNEWRFAADRVERVVALWRWSRRRAWPRGELCIVRTTDSDDDESHELRIESA
jgi:hypothetical protein